MSNWKPWGDHPYVVGVVVVTAIISTIVALKQMYDSPDNHQPGKNAEPGKQGDANKDVNPTKKFSFKPEPDKPIYWRLGDAARNSLLEVRLLEIDESMGKLSAHVSVCNSNSKDFNGPVRKYGPATLVVYTGDPKKDKETRDRIEQKRRQEQKERDLYYLSLWFTGSEMSGSIKWGDLIYGSISPGQCINAIIDEDGDNKIGMEKKVHYFDKYNGIFHARLGEGEVAKVIMIKY